MHLEHYKAERLEKEIVEIISRHLDVRRDRVFFFGSRVSGKASDLSDIDVGIEGPAPVPRRVLRSIREAL